MADENKPAFYPRVGRSIAKNFRSAQPKPFIDDPRAMDLPQFGDIDLSVPNKANLEMARRIAQRDADVKRQSDADMSPLEKLAGGMQAGRFLGSALAQSVASIPTAITKGGKAAEDYIAENIYKPNQPKGLEYAQDVGEFLERLETDYKLPPVATGEVLGFAPLIQTSIADAARKGTGAAVRGGMALERKMEPVVRGALERGGLPREMAMAMGQGTQSNVIKPVGGNWIPGRVEEALEGQKSLKIAGETPAQRIPKHEALLKDESLNQDQIDRVKYQLEVAKREAAIDNWVDTNLTNYITKQMGTEKDPIRLLADQGITHFADEGAMRRALSTSYDQFARNRKVRENFGMPVDPMAKTSLGRTWEEGIDDLMGMTNIIKAKNYGRFDIREKNPWMNKLDPNSNLYSIDRLMPGQMNFGHIIDVLQADLASGRMSPADLKNVSMDRAVRRTAEYDQEKAKAMAEAAIKQQNDLPIYKDYPDQGYKWVDLSVPEEEMLPQGYKIVRNPDVISPKDGEPYMMVDPQGEAVAFGRSPGDIMYGVAPDMKPGYERLKKILDYEGNTMGHCVGSYCDEVSGGGKKIYSLRDSRGEPHVTIEVLPDTTPPRIDQIKKYMAAATEEAMQLPQGYTSRDISDIATRMAMENAPPTIMQIKGKQNRAPKDQYLPFVQDFVRSRDWQEINDLHNTGLMSLDDAFPDYEMVKAFNRTYPDKQFVNKKEVEDFTKQFNNPQPPQDGMKRGGKVSISSNPDTMMLEVNNQKMKNGEPAYAGGKLITTQTAKAAKVQPPIKFPVTRGPSIPEIRAMAERMAPQVMGEFVRAAPTPSNPKPSTSVVGKTQKQFEREKTLPIQYQNIMPEVTPNEFDYAKNKGALLIGTSGDVTPGNRLLLSIDNQPLSTPVHLQAGPEWELYNPSAWAASDQMAKTYMKRAEKAADAYGAEPYLHYHKMTPDANWYAMHHLNSILGHLRPEELKLRDPKLYQQMVEEIRTKDVGFGKHPEFEGFDDPLNLQIHAQIDPNFRRHLGAIFGGPKFTERYGLNSGQDVLAATSLPELRDLEPGASGYAIVPLDVKAPLKNFEADSHTYDTGFPKAGPSGRSKYPSPYQLIYRDTLNWMKDNPSENKSSEFGRMNMIVPKQQIDNELIEAIGEYQRRMKELTGKKKGGAIKKPIKKAAGGAITGDDLIIEERPL